MGSIKFTYDDENIKDIKIISTEDNKEGRKEMLETIKIFCLDSIPNEYNPIISETEDGFLVTSEEHGEETLTHIFRYTYLVIRAAAVFIEEFKNETELNVDNLDLGKLKADIDLVSGMGYREIGKLIGEISDEKQQ